MDDFDCFVATVLRLWPGFVSHAAILVYANPGFNRCGTLNCAVPSTRLSHMRAANRKWRGWIALIALISFSFAQLAVAAYVCPASDDAAQLERMARGDGDCHRSDGYPHDTDNAQLCKAYCERGAQVKPSAAFDPPDLTDFTRSTPVARPVSMDAVEHSDSYRAPHGGPPLYLRNCVLRN